MRIQHNIAALNSYRNLTNNNSAVSKNLEKLSSGYRINRAGDDAAGLAISEKMRAQITGLKTAQKNANDGISLVQTAEGAMTEIHSMLNRMVELADQSANGTYADEVDRENLQKEITSLKDEVNRIADATNFNGINLLDGSLASTGKATSSNFKGWDSIKGALAAGLTDVKATKAKDVVDLAQVTAGNAAGGEKFTMSIAMSDGKKYDFEITAKLDPDDATKFNFVDKDGNELLSAADTATGGLKDDNIGKAFEKLIKESELGKIYDVSYASAKITMEAKVAGAGPANVDAVDMKQWDENGAVKAFGGTNKIAGPEQANSVKGADAYQSLDLSQAKVFDDDTDHTALEKAVFEINGEKFVFIEKDAVDDENIAKMREAGVEHWVEVGTTSTVGATDIESMVEKIKHSTGLDVKQGTNTNGVWADASTGTHIKIADGASTQAGGGLTLQIGDTSADFNQLRVSVSDMHTKALGIADIDISTQAGAKAAVDKIKNAINSVSSTRGDLGAIQNRLEHTINNLSVTTENMTAAESRIRDVDMAEEMMAYTKNNILVQASQAMLAQANQIPQGVLQLLQ